jgi:hypothetical protein
LSKIARPVGDNDWAYDAPTIVVYEDQPLQQPIGFVHWPERDIVVVDDIVTRPLTRKQRKAIKKAIEQFGR